MEGIRNAYYLESNLKHGCCTTELRQIHNVVDTGTGLSTNFTNQESAREGTDRSHRSKVLCGTCHK